MTRSKRVTTSSARIQSGLRPAGARGAIAKRNPSAQPRAAAKKKVAEQLPAVAAKAARVTRSSVELVAPLAPVATQAPGVETREDTSRPQASWGRRSKRSTRARAALKDASVLQQAAPTTPTAPPVLSRASLALMAFDNSHKAYEAALTKAGGQWTDELRAALQQRAAAKAAVESVPETERSDVALNLRFCPMR